MAKTAAQAEPEQDAPPPEDLEDVATPWDRRAKVMGAIDQTRRDMLREGGVEITEGEDDGGADPGEGKPAAAAGGEDGDPGEDEGDTHAQPGKGSDDDGDAGEPEQPAEQPPADGADAGRVEEPGEEPPAQQAEKNYFSGDPTQVFVKTMVDGQEVEVPLSEAIASHQVRSSADQRMQIANRLLEDAEKLRDRLTQGEGPRPSEDKGGAGGEKPSGPTPAGTPQLDGIDWSGLGQKLQYESPEDAGTALRQTIEQIINQGAGGQATRDELEASIMDRLEWNQSVERFRTDYKDLQDDPILRQITGNLANAFWGQAVQHAQQNGGGRPSYWEVWDAAGKAAREWLKGKGGGEQADSAEETSSGRTPDVAINPDRAQRKRAAAQPPEPRQPQPSAPQNQPDVNSEKSLLATRQSAIADLQKRRGQAFRA